MSDLVIVGLTSSYTFTKGGSKVKLFRGTDLALVRRLKDTLARIARRDAKVQASTSKTRVNKTPILDDGTPETAAAVARMQARITSCLSMTRTH